MYNYLTFADLKTQVATYLSDAGMVYWTDEEIGILINAALREFNSISRIFRDRGAFDTVAGQIFYDLRTLLLNGAGEAFLNPTITDSQLLIQAKFMLIEPNPDSTVTFTDGFSLGAFMDGFIQLRNEFLLETGIYISQPAAQVVSAGTGRVQFDDVIIDVRRVTWTDLDGNINQLLREDEYTSFTFDPSWVQDSGTPQRYSIYPDPLLTIQLIPPPIDNGTLTLQTISSGLVPDDFTPFILWGVLGDLLAAPGPGNDPLRAQYCAQRFSEGLVIGKQYATLQQGYLNEIPVTASAVYDLDTFQPDWQSSGSPSSIAILGSNLIGVAPIADGVYNVLIDSVRNAPQLVASTDLMPIGREYINLFIDYIGHLAVFKHGGQEFRATFPQYDAFVKAAIAYNNRMSAQNLHFDTLVDAAQQQEMQQSLRKEAAA